MAPTGDEEIEYESDPEEVKRSLTMRRKEASDDEDDEGDRGDNDGRRGNRRTEIHSDESDGQGGVAEYDNDEEEDLVIDGEYVEDSYDEEEEDIEEGDDEEVGDDREYIGGNEKRSMAGRAEGLTKDMEVDRRRNGEEAMEDHAADHMDEEEEKEKQPFAVPTAGAFYMHDDRFQENPGGRHRRMRGGRKLWESRDDRKWGHDKFEEMNKQEKQYEERRRTSRGRFRGRGRGRGQERGYVRGSSSKAFNSNGNQKQLPKVVTRGRGPRRYETAMRNGNQAPSAQNKQSRNFREKNSHHDTGHARTPIASSETDVIQAKKNVVASSLNSASPPFYPSGSSNNLTQKDIQAAMGRLHVNDSTSTTGKNSGNAKISSSGSSLVYPAQSSQSVSQGRGVPAPGQVMYQQSLNQVDRVSSPMQLHSVLKGSVQSCQPSAQTSDQQSAVIRSLASSPPKTSSSKNSYTSGDMESASETVAKGKGSLQASGRGSFMYSGTQVMGPAGSLAVGHGNPNFPAFLPVMPFGGQHGGVPTFGMAFPGYVAQSEHGLGNSEMTWLPILTGPGALGATYCSPYAPIEGPYQARKPGLPSSTGSSSKENNTSKTSDEPKPPEGPELTNKEIPQRQSNPNKQLRRYSEMSFSK